MSSNLEKIGIPSWVGATTDKGTIPTAETLSGLISHTNGSQWVTGDDDTLFLSEVKIGDYIYANDVIRKILEVDSNKRLLIDSSFGADLTNENFKVSRSGKYRKVSIKNSGLNAGSLFGVSFPAGEVVNYSESSGLAPVVYDAQTGSTTFLIATEE